MHIVKYSEPIYWNLSATFIIVLFHSYIYDPLKVYIFYRTTKLFELNDECEEYKRYSQKINTMIIFELEKMDY